MEKTIFIIEDDEIIVSVLKDYLEQWGFRVASVRDFQFVSEEFQELCPDLVLLDISLPFFNGFHWCQELRKESEVPIIFLSSAEGKMNQIMAMNLGADDFIGKPFDLEVLVAKIHALLRRSYQYGQQVKIEFRDFTFYPLDNQLKTAKETLILSPTETRIFSLLMQHPGEVIAREAIIQELWNSEEFIDNNTLSVNITRIRKKLQSIGIEQLIQTVKNRGYLIER